MPFAERHTQQPRAFPEKVVKNRTRKQASKDPWDREDLVNIQKAIENCHL
jgi:hypothetical protein